jgi:hypothetical protein
LPQQKPNLPRGLEGGTPSASKFSSETFSTKTTFVPFDYIDNGILKTSKRDLERQGRPSRGTPMPPGYGYLTHHLPRKVTHTRISDSATEQVLTLKIRGKKMQLYTLTLKKFRPQQPQEIHILKTNCSRQAQVSAGEGVAPSVSFPPAAESGPASDGDTGGRISTSKKEASTAPRPSAAASSLWTSDRAASSSSGKQ